MLIKKIVSGGQTGADRAALDFAIKYHIFHGGWVPKGRLAEDGVISEKYNVHEAPTEDYERRTELNVVHSDGTLIITHGKLSGGSLRTKEFAEKHKRPCLHIDLASSPEFKATIDITRWIKEKGIEILNIAGSRASKDNEIYDAVMKLLDAVFMLRNIDDGISDLIYKQHHLPFKKKAPKIVEEAVDKLISEMKLKDRVGMAGMAEDDLENLRPFLFYIRKNNSLWDDNILLEACRELTGDKELHADGASLFFVKKLWEKLKKTHLLRKV